ncbi:uncharacterized protein [Procambarus clarkii]|uniref:uncharacterized protein n=1 Tax=Procambarus clarkii TaxID=6728 RepID=UPI0037444B8F
MEVCLLGMTPIISMYRLIGGLPFTWTCGRSNKETLTLDSLQKTKRNKKWTVWSFVFGFAIASYFSYGGLGFMSIFDKTASTYTVILKVEDVVGMCTSILLRIHMLGQAPALIKALGRMQILCGIYGFKAAPFYKERHIIIVMGHHLIAFLCICYGNITMALKEKQLKFFRIGNMFKASVKPLVFNLTMMMYCHLINLLAVVYSKFFDTVVDDVGPSLSHLNSWTSSSKRNTTKNLSASVNHLGINAPSRINFEKAKALLIDLYDCHHMIKTYFQFLIALALLHCTISSIVSCFLASLQAHRHFPEHVAAFGQLLLTLFPPFFLTNVPRVLDIQREKLRVQFKRMRHTTSRAMDKTEMLDLLELLEEDPGFNMGGFFTLSRARIVDVGSHTSPPSPAHTSPPAPATSFCVNFS